MTIEQLEEELLNLPPAARARLAKRLISSLDEDGEISYAVTAGDKVARERAPEPCVR